MKREVRPTAAAASSSPASSLLSEGGSQKRIHTDPYKSILVWMSKDLQIWVPQKNMNFLFLHVSAVIMILHGIKIGLKLNLALG